MTNVVKEITPLELKSLFDAKKKIAVLDVREDEELLISAIPGATHIPLMLVEYNIEMWKDACVGADYRVVICRSGMRSAKAAEWLNEELNIEHLNLAGGINAYATQVDPSLETY